MTTVHRKLVMALTEYDRKQAGKRGYNPYALGQYIARLHDIDADIENGAPVRDAIVAAFSGRLLDVCLRAVGEPKAQLSDRRSSSYCYRPASGR